MLTDVIEFGLHIRVGAVSDLFSNILVVEAVHFCEGILVPSLKVQGKLFIGH
jgi:hypothetical protein